MGVLPFESLNFGNLKVFVEGAVKVRIASLTG
jgi:hypothetical protein